MAGAATNGELRSAGTPELLRLATAGSVDDGKSTLIGRLLFETKQILEDQYAAIERSSRERGDSYVNLALLTDGLRAEREQGITIDVAYRYFQTARRKFIVADTPGHKEYTRNMVTGASNAALAVILVDARKGILEQSKRHAFIATLLGIPHLVVCVNKMDLVAYDEAVFDHICAEFSSFAAKLDVPDLTFIPISALHGDNVVEPSANMPWYEGASLLYHLEHTHLASDRNLVDCRFPVQWVIEATSETGDVYRGCAGQVAAGTFRPGDEVMVLPSGKTTRIAAIDSFDGPVPQARPPMSVTIRLEDDPGASRGDMICRPRNAPAPTQVLDSMVCWMNDRPLVPGARYAVKHTTRTVRAHVDELQYAIDVNTLHRRQGVNELTLNDVGRVRIDTEEPLLVDDYRRSRATGGFILIDETTGATVGAGMVLEKAA